MPVVVGFWRSDPVPPLPVVRVIWLSWRCAWARMGRPSGSNSVNCSERLWVTARKITGPQWKRTAGGRLLFLSPPVGSPTVMRPMSCSEMSSTSDSSASPASKSRSRLRLDGLPPPYCSVGTSWPGDFCSLQSLDFEME